MKEIEKLYDRIIQRTNINLRELEFDVNPYVRPMIPFSRMMKYYAFYAVSPNHPLNFQFKHSNLAGSYFFGKCRVKDALLYKSDIRGDELKTKGDVFRYQDFEIPVSSDEEITIEDSLLIKTLVHNMSHDPESLETFFIRNTVSMHHANIHGAPSDGCFVGPWATVDLTTMRDCVIGSYSYIQAGEINHLNIQPGTIWVRAGDDFNFLYRFPEDQLKDYIYFNIGTPPQGKLVDFVENRKDAFQRIYEVVNLDTPIHVPDNTHLDRYAVIRPITHLGENVLVSQRAYLQNCTLGHGANAQENCYIINSTLEGFNVTAHGAKIIEASLSPYVFVGFNSYLKGDSEARISIGEGSIIMPHTIIEPRQPLTIPESHIVWGLIRNQEELEQNSIAINDLTKVDSYLSKGNMIFEGSGTAFVESFLGRIHHILEANGAFYDGSKNKGHAQQNQDISFNTIQPYSEGEMKGMYPSITIEP